MSSFKKNGSVDRITVLDNSRKKKNFNTSSFDGSSSPRSSNAMPEGKQPFKPFFYVSSCHQKRPFNSSTEKWKKGAKSRQSCDSDISDLAYKMNRQFSNGFSKKVKDDVWFDRSSRSEEFETQFMMNQVQSGINFDKYDDIPVTVEGKTHVDPVDSMDSLKFDEVFKDNIKLMGYTKLTPIQKYAFPCLLDRHDLLGCAQTGSGKTAAFVLPLVNLIYQEGHYNPVIEPRTVAPKALILAPTRELASQIYEQVMKFSYRTKLKPSILYGGVGINMQFSDMMKGGHLIIGTPGRVNDMYERRMISFRNCKYVVLDEADRMLDMGFNPQIANILSNTDMPPTQDRLNCMFSATFPSEVVGLIRNYMNDYVKVTVGRVGHAAEDVLQTVLRATEDTKFKMLCERLVSGEKILIFTETRRMTEKLENALFRENYNVVGIHGLRSQNERDMALSLFKSNKANIMVATGVASRGLDIPNVSKVIIYEMPNNIDEYVHRIGRTGRAGNVGEAMVFFTEEDSGLAKELVQILREAKQNVPEFLQSMSLNSYSSKNKSFGQKRTQQFGNRNKWGNTGNWEFPRNSFDSNKW